MRVLCMRLADTMQCQRYEQANSSYGWDFALQEASDVWVHLIGTSTFITHINNDRIAQNLHIS